MAQMTLTLHMRQTWWLRPLLWILPPLMVLRLVRITDVWLEDLLMRHTFTRVGTGPWRSLDEDRSEPGGTGQTEAETS